MINFCGWNLSLLFLRRGAFDHYVYSIFSRCSKPFAVSTFSCALWAFEVTDGHICIELSNCRTIHALLVVHYDLGNDSVYTVHCMQEAFSGTDDTFS